MCPLFLQLQQQGILKSDDLITRFFRISVEMCVDLCYRTLADHVGILTSHTRTHTHTHTQHSYMLRHTVTLTVVLKRAMFCQL